MSTIDKDLERFLKTDGLKIVMNSAGTRVEPYKPLTIEGYGSVSAINPEELDADSLQDLLDKAEDIQSALEDQLSDIEDLSDRVQDRLDELEDED